jgi:hypothetical protein
MSVPKSMRDRDWLRDFQFLLGAGVIVFAGVLVARLVWLVADGAVCAGMVGGGIDVRIAGLRPGAEAANTASVCVESPSTGQLLLMLLHEAPTYIAAGIAAALLYRVVRDTRRQDPFTSLTVRRLRQLAWFVLISGFVVTAAVNTTSGWLLRTMVQHGTAPSERMWSWLFVAVGIGATAEIVNRGVALRTELDTVI